MTEKDRGGSFETSVAELTFDFTAELETVAAVSVTPEAAEIYGLSSSLVPHVHNGRLDADVGVRFLVVSPDEIDILLDSSDAPEEIELPYEDYKSLFRIVRLAANKDDSVPTFVLGARHRPENLRGVGEHLLRNTRADQVGVSPEDIEIDRERDADAISDRVQHFYVHGFAMEAATIVGVATNATHWAGQSELGEQEYVRIAKARGIELQYVATRYVYENLHSAFCTDHFDNELAAQVHGKEA